MRGRRGAEKTGKSDGRVLDGFMYASVRCPDSETRGNGGYLLLSVASDVGEKWQLVMEIDRKCIEIERASQVFGSAAGSVWQLMIMWATLRGC